MVLSDLPRRQSIIAASPPLKIVLEGEELYEVEGRTVKLEPGLLRVARIQGSDHMTYSDFNWMVETAGSTEAMTSARRNKIAGARAWR